MLTTQEEGLFRDNFHQYSFTKAKIMRSDLDLVEFIDRTNLYYKIYTLVIQKPCVRLFTFPSHIRIIHNVFHWNYFNEMKITVERGERKRCNKISEWNTQNQCLHCHIKNLMVQFFGDEWCLQCLSGKGFLCNRISFLLISQSFNKVDWNLN